MHDGCPGQAKQPLECGGDAHVALLCEPLTFKQPAASCEGGGASIKFCATSADYSPPHARLKFALTATLQSATSPTRREETPFFIAFRCERLASLKRDASFHARKQY